jgi:enhancing lycopene biosynthesis protein 2
MTELRSKIPRRIGVLLSSETLWEIVYIFYQIDHNGYMRLPIIYEPAITDPQHGSERKEIYDNLGRIETAKTVDVKTGSLQALIICAGKEEFDRLSNFDKAGEAFGVDQGWRAFLRAAYRRGLPIGAFGYAVPLMVKAIQGLTTAGPVVTVGNNPKLQSGIEAAGAQAVPTRPTEVIIDETNHLVTSGGQLATNRPIEVAADCENMFKAIMELIKG